MPRFKFSLATVLKLREAARDERRAELAQAIAADETLSQHVVAVDGELAALRDSARRDAGPGTLNIDHLLELQRWELLLKAQRGQIVRNRELLAAEIERRRQALVLADRDVRVLEKLREKQRERHRYEENRREIRQLDEIGQMRSLIEESA